MRYLRLQASTAASLTRGVDALRAVIFPHVEGVKGKGIFDPAFPAFRFEDHKASSKLGFLSMPAWTQESCEKYTGLPCSLAIGVLSRV